MNLMICHRQVKETIKICSTPSGLDPAGPMWNYNRNRLQPTDGVYVEAIHTDGGYTVGGLGIGSAIAQVRCSICFQIVPFCFIFY